MKILSKREALDLLADMTEEDYIDNGSSRAVYDVMFEGRECVMKIALDRQGRNQNVLEANLYAECGGTYLANIYARYSNVLLICEKVYMYDRDFVENVAEYGCDADYELLRYDEDNDEEVYIEVWEAYDYRSCDDCQRVIDDIRDAYNYLCDYQGDTSDNNQIGYREGGEAVAYDYGYSTDQEWRDIVGKIYRHVDRGTVLEECVEYITDNAEVKVLEVEYE